MREFALRHWKKLLIAGLLAAGGAPLSMVVSGLLTPEAHAASAGGVSGGVSGPVLNGGNTNTGVYFFSPAGTDVIMPFRDNTNTQVGYIRLGSAGAELTNESNSQHVSLTARRSTGSARTMIDCDPGIANTTTSGRCVFVNQSDVGKLVPESVTSSTTLQDDDVFTTSALNIGDDPSGGTDLYAITAYFLVDTGGSAGININMQWVRGGSVNPSIQLICQSVTTGDVLQASVIWSNSTAKLFTVPATGLSISCQGEVQVTGTSSTMKLQWAQGTSSGTSTILQNGSWIRLHKLT